MSWDLGGLLELHEQLRPLFRLLTGCNTTHGAYALAGHEEFERLGEAMHAVWQSRTSERLDGNSPLRLTHERFKEHVHFVLLLVGWEEHEAREPGLVIPTGTALGIFARIRVFSERLGDLMPEGVPGGPIGGDERESANDRGQPPKGFIGTNTIRFSSELVAE